MKTFPHKGEAGKAGTEGTEDDGCEGWRDAATKARDALLRASWRDQFSLQPQGAVQAC